MSGTAIVHGTNGNTGAVNWDDVAGEDAYVYDDNIETFPSASAGIATHMGTAGAMHGTMHGTMQGAVNSDTLENRIFGQVAAATKRIGGRRSKVLTVACLSARLASMLAVAAISTVAACVHT